VRNGSESENLRLPGIKEHANSQKRHIYQLNERQKKAASLGVPEPRYGSPISESTKLKLLQDKIEIAEEELALIKKNKGDRLTAQ